jgi:ribosomal protein L32
VKEFYHLRLCCALGELFDITLQFCDACGEYSLAHVQEKETHFLHIY